VGRAHRAWGSDVSAALDVQEHPLVSRGVEPPGPFGLAIRRKRTELDERGYSLAGTRKVQEGASHPERNAQFE
jgi:hypothetical protein